MSSYELTLNPIRPERNRVTGKFLKGHKAWNKGRHPKDYLSPESYIKFMEMCKRNTTYKGIKKPMLCRKVVAVYPDGKWRVFDSVTDAADSIGVHKTRVSMSCRTTRRVHSIKFYYESDNWESKVM